MAESIKSRLTLSKRTALCNGNHLPHRLASVPQGCKLFCAVILALPRDKNRGTSRRARTSVLFLAEYASMGSFRFDPSDRIRTGGPQQRAAELRISVRFARTAAGQNRNNAEQKQRLPQRGILCFGPSDWIRTSGLLNPIQARYQTSPHPDFLNARI